MLRNDRCIV